VTGQASTMRAAFYRRFGPASEVIEIGELATPEPGHGEVLVRIMASGLNPHDTKKRSGWLGVPMAGERVVPHSDGAGTIVAVGPGVPPERIGERVFVFGAGTARPGEGTAAEHAAVPATNALPLPEALTYGEGASIGVPAFTAFYAVLGDGSVSGRTVLVQGGAGAVGSVAIELARWNAATVIATVSSDDKAEIARASGADHVIDYHREDVAARVLEITGGAGVDRIVEVDFGANVAVDAACLKINGTVASYSSTRVREPVLPYYGFALRGARLLLLQAGNMPEDIRQAAARTISALLSRGRLRPRLGASVPLDSIAMAHDLLESGKVVGNIVIDVAPPS
jgi:NADPH:quinone reductase